MPTGPLAAATAYIIWGLFPLYLKQLAHVPAFEITVHRSLWSLAFVFVLLAALGRLGWLRDALRQRRVIGVFAISALLLSVNWFIYVWAVNTNRVIDSSLGYFINPLVNVMLGFFVLHERPRPWQWAAVGLAAAGVLWLTVAAGQLPWIALVLAASFGTYGLVRKTAPLGAMEGLALETLMLAPLMAAALVAIHLAGNGHFGAGDLATDFLLVVAGPFTAIPLMLFAAGARRVTMATLGLLQYLGPSIQFLLGVYLYREPFDTTRGIGFVLIWSALVLYTGESLWRMRRVRAA
jgi:chloramphenicol-sensitive protein RarD